MKEAKQFLFEKKNQKTFGSGPSLSGKTEAKNRQKFFASFFQKRSPFFLR
jgi:hypothetical protein